MGTKKVMKRTSPAELNKHIKEMPDVAKLLKKRRTVHRTVRIVFGVISVMAIVGLILFFRSKPVQIYSISVIGNEIIDTDTVVSEVQNSLSGKYFYLIPRTNIFFYPKGKVYSNIKKDFPRFDTLSVSLVGKTTLVIKVTEERGTALWCGQSQESFDITKQCYFTDTKGKIIDLAPYYSGNVYLRFFGGNISDVVTSPLGKSFVNEKDFHDFMLFSQKISGLGFRVKSLVLGREDNTFLLDLDGKNTAKISFKNSDNFETLFSNLQTAMSQKALSDQVSKNISGLQYFDLRFKNKVYYKFNDMVATSTKKHD